MRDDSCEPIIIQGGMGVGVSNWRLARSVSATGQLGVVSGTAIDQVFARRLQDGDPGGHLRQALAAFPFPAMAERVANRYLVPGGRAPHLPYRPVPMWSLRPSPALQELCIVANFAEVWLAKAGHPNPVGINYLEKIQWPHLASLFGAMLAGVDVVLMGAGIPLKVPGVLDALARFDDAEYSLSVIGGGADCDTRMTFSPSAFSEGKAPVLRRPRFFAIVASNTLATTMLRRANGKVDGLVIEGHTAGGHNAPPRGPLVLDDVGQPVYGQRDEVDLRALSALGVPFWLAGGYGTPEGVAAALAQGAAGVQVGTAFAYCDEAGVDAGLKARVRDAVSEGRASVYTDRLASPTGFPFKVVRLPETVSESDVYARRPRVCDLGYLRESFRTPDGRVGYRCAAEPVEAFVHKGGDVDAAQGRKCICNALMAAGGFPQVRDDGLQEPPIVTAGDDLAGIARFMTRGGRRYDAASVVDALLAGIRGPRAERSEGDGTISTCSSADPREGPPPLPVT